MLGHTLSGEPSSLSLPLANPSTPNARLLSLFLSKKKKYIYIYMELLETVCAVISLAEGGSEWLLTK